MSSPEQRIFKIFLKVLVEVLDEEIINPEKKSVILNKILDNFNFELMLKIQALKNDKKNS